MFRCDVLPADGLVAPLLADGARLVTLSFRWVGGGSPQQDQAVIEDIRAQLLPLFG